MDDKVHEIMFPDKPESEESTNVMESSNPRASEASPSTSSDEEGNNGGEKKRKCYAMTMKMPAFGNSPPNFVSFEEIMSTANDLERMALVNEIVLNEDFKIEKKEERNPLQKAIRENMQKAFWDIVAEQIAETPPNYEKVVAVLGEMKETLMLFLMPQHTQLKAEIDEVLDFELMQQQLDNEAFEYGRYAQFIVSVCSRLCSPSRDEIIRKLTQTTELIPLFQGIFDLLEKMRLDLSNFYIRQYRTQIQKSSAEYEREKFKNLVETHQKYNMDVLEHTTNWLKRSYESLDLAQENNLKNVCYKITIAAYMDLLKCMTPAFSSYIVKEGEAGAAMPDDNYPETVLLIRKRVEAIRESVFKLTLISSVFVVTFAVVGEPLQSVKEFREELKTKLDAIVAPGEGKLLQFMKQEELKAILDSAAQQVCISIRESIVKYQNNPNATIDEKKLESLQFQITELGTAQNRIRTVMERRILEFIERVIASATADPVQIPSGLSSFSTEVTQVAGNFSRLVGYNRSVYSPYYTRIIAKITAEKHYITPAELQEIERSFSG